MLLRSFGILQVCYKMCFSYAFVGDATDIKYAEMINCDLQMVGKEFSSKPYALAVQQGSPLKDILTDG